MTVRMVTYQCSLCLATEQREAIPDYGEVYMPDMWYCVCCRKLSLFNAISAAPSMTAIGIPDTFEDEDDEDEDAWEPEAI